MRPEPICVLSDSSFVDLMRLPSVLGSRRPRSRESAAMAIWQLRKKRPLAPARCRDQPRTVKTPFVVTVQKLPGIAVGYQCGRLAVSEISICVILITSITSALD
jgi:hypothetical protein